MTRVSCATSISNVILALVLPVVAMVENSPGSEADKKVKKTWGKAVEAQALSIGSLRAAYAPGEPILLKVCFKNVGEKDVKVVYADPLGLYQVSVLLPDGKPAPLTLFGIQRESGPRVSVLPRDGKPAPLTLFGIQREAGPRESSEFALGTLKPGEETCDELELSRLFDFTLAGKYTVSVQRAVSVSSTLKATSNKLELTVDESIGGADGPVRSLLRLPQTTVSEDGREALCMNRR